MKILSRSLLIFTSISCLVSCKKDNSNPNSTSNTNTVSTYSNISFDIALVDRTTVSWTGTYGSNCRAYIICNNVVIDSLLNLDTTVTADLSFDDCPLSSYVHLNSKVFKVQDNGTNYLDVYEGGSGLGGTRIGHSEIRRSPDKLFPLSGSLAPAEPTNNYVAQAGCTNLMILQW